MKAKFFVAALAVLSLTTPALAASNEKYQFKGEGAFASFSQSDGCNSTYVDVSAYDSISKSAPGAPDAQKEAFLSYSNYNYCTGTGSYGYGSLVNPSFTISNSLKSAALKGTFTITDESGKSKTIEVDLTWTGTGDTYRGNYHSHYQAAGYTYHSRSVGANRDAQVLGSVNLDGKNIIENLPAYAQLNSSNNGSLTITRR